MQTKVNKEVFRFIVLGSLKEESSSVFFSFSVIAVELTPTQGGDDLELVMFMNQGWLHCSIYIYIYILFLKQGVGIEKFKYKIS